MPTVTVSRTLPFPRSEVFAKLNDFGGIHRFHPAIGSSPLAEGSPAGGEGAERTCHFYDGNHVEERVSRVVTDSELDVDIVGGSLPMKNASGKFRLTDTADGGTEVVMHMAYTPPFGVVGTVLNALVIERKFTGLLNLLLSALEHHMATGEEITKGWKAAA